MPGSTKKGRGVRGAKGEPKDRAEPRVPIWGRELLFTGIGTPPDFSPSLHHNAKRARRLGFDRPSRGRRTSTSGQGQILPTP